MSGVAAYAVVCQYCTGSSICIQWNFPGMSADSQVNSMEKAIRKRLQRVLRLGIILALIMAAAIILGIMAGAEVS